MCSRLRAVLRRRLTARPRFGIEPPCNWVEIRSLSWLYPNLADAPFQIDPDRNPSGTVVEGAPDDVFQLLAGADDSLKCGNCIDPRKAMAVELDSHGAELQAFDPNVFHGPAAQRESNRSQPAQSAFD